MDAKTKLVTLLSRGPAGIDTILISGDLKELLDQKVKNVTLRECLFRHKQMFLSQGHLDRTRYESRVAAILRVFLGHEKVQIQLSTGVDVRTGKAVVPVTRSSYWPMYKTATKKGVSKHR